ncbi:hypothetical protein [Bradyrhizobium algeriense]|uniref:hypothetical protein n=1 Tax=Bradyrhizobium algeriense TaxID=634784 RepID=UPI000D336C94|nr:hypothetical protein [Bradyrhizobium algeriense]
MRKYILSASLLTMLASSALAEEALLYRDCRQSEGRFGWFAVSYTITDGKRTEKSAQDLNKACTRLDYEDSRRAAASWGEKSPRSQGQSTDNQRRNTNDTRDDTSNGRQSRDDTSDRRGSRSGSDSGGGRDFGGGREIGSSRDSGSRSILGGRGGEMNMPSRRPSTEGNQVADSGQRPSFRHGKRKDHFNSGSRFGSNRRYYGSYGRHYGNGGRFYGSSGRFYGGMSVRGPGYYRMYR